MNSAVEFNFEEKFAEIRTCKSHEQCMGPTQKTQPQHKCKRVFISKLTQNMDFVKIFKNCNGVFGTCTKKLKICMEIRLSEKVCENTYNIV